MNPPQPLPRGAVAELSCELPGGARVAFTTRAAGNLSTLRGEHHEHALRAREQLSQDLGLQWLCASRQVHGTTVQRVRSAAGTGAEPVAIDADGHSTALAGIGATVLTADCLPVGLGCEGAVAMLHAGWRGLADGVLEEGVRALREVGGRGAIVAAIGPGAGVCCYEVGPEVHAAFAGRHREGRNIDLRAIARQRLLAAGVAQVCEARACTICDERFFSHRREGERAGRQGGVAWLS
jgi:purine-nucleoside/S-methyl-5'-thioadenosine phosphorylase / adenosine deaminase